MIKTRLCDINGTSLIYFHQGPERNAQFFFNHDLGYTGMQVCMDLCICAFAYDVKQRCCYTSLILPCAVPSNIFNSPFFSIMLLKRYLCTPICPTSVNWAYTAVWNVLICVAHWQVLACNSLCPLHCSLVLTVILLYGRLLHCGQFKSLTLTFFDMKSSTF